jgi:Arc/MetJ-type ribon-helix-helix transcriptional regulator
MKTITVNVKEEICDKLDEEADEKDYSSRSEYLRDIIDSRHEAEKVREEYEQKLTETEREYEDQLEKSRQEVEQAQARADDLRRQLQAREEKVEEKVETLVERTERQDDALAEVLERQQRGVFGRTKRWLFGKKDSKEA